MFAIFQILESGFMISLVITLVLAVLLVLYFRQKIIDMEHKIKSMFELVELNSTELVKLKTNFQGLQNQGQSQNQNENQNQNQLFDLMPVGDNDIVMCDDDNKCMMRPHKVIKLAKIPVSDDEDDENEDEYEDSDEQGEENRYLDVSEKLLDEMITVSNSNAGYGIYGGDVDICVGMGGQLFMKNNDNKLMMIFADNTSPFVKSGNIGKSFDLSEMEVEYDEEIETKDETRNEPEPEHDESDDDDAEEDEITVTSTSVKTMATYKKMSVGELRKLAVEKELVEDAGKMKKTELISLLASSN